MEPTRHPVRPITMTPDDADQWTYDYDALEERGLAEDPRAWAAIEVVRRQLREYGRRRL